jgi:transcriptional regulator with XRE-family HTH domain
MTMTPADLKAWRKRHKLSQSQAGELLGYGKTSLYRWECGDLPIPTVVALACRGHDDAVTIDNLANAIERRA